jgi:hypothetical protein
MDFSGVSGSEDDYDKMVKKQREELDSQEQTAGEDECSTCSPPIYSKDLRRRSVGHLSKKHDNFEAAHTSASHLSICKDCKRILSAEEKNNAI